MTKTIPTPISKTIARMDSKMKFQEKLASMTQEEIVAYVTELSNQAKS